MAQLGRIAPNVLYSNAYSGHGVNVTHLCGEIIADTIGGTLERFDVMSSVPAARIPGINILGNTLVNLGVLWYGLQDRL